MPETGLTEPAAMASNVTPSDAVAAERPVVAELPKSATEALKCGEPYFFYYEESVAERNAMAVKKQPLQYVPKHLDWYCRICGQWVDDEQESIVCSHDECEDVYHLKCTGLKVLPEGEWYCPEPGCIHSRGSILPKAVPGAEPCSHRWESMPPLHVGTHSYRRVLCDGERVYYALTPFARDMTGLQDKELADAMRTTSGYPDYVYMRESVFPHDVARLRELRMMNGVTRNRALVTADAIFRVFKKPWTPLVEQRMTALRAALDADQQNRDSEASGTGMKRGREEDSTEADDDITEMEAKGPDADLDEENACQPHPVLDGIAQLQLDIMHFRATIENLENEAASLKKAVQEKIAAAAAASQATESSQTVPAPSQPQQQQPEQSQQQQQAVQWQ